MTRDGVICAVIDGQTVPIVCDQTGLQCADGRFVQRVQRPQPLCRVPDPAPWLSERVVQELRRVSDNPIRNARTAVCCGFWVGWRKAMTRALCRTAETLLCAGQPGDAAGTAYVALLMAPKEENACRQHAPESTAMLCAMTAYLRALDREWANDDPSGADRSFGSMCRRFRVSPGSALAVKLAVRGGRGLLEGLE